MIRKNFFFIFSMMFWLLMAIGFSDNWLFDIGQKSNSEPKFLIHACLAFCWFTLLVIQSGLVRKRNYKLHFKLGLVGVVIYYLMTLTIWSLYYESFKIQNDWLKLVKPLEILSIVLTTFAFVNRKKNAKKHKEYMIFGTFCIIGPAVDRTVFHLLGPELMNWPMIISYWLMFGVFLWYKKVISWYMVFWIIFWIYSLYPLLLEML